jgi:uncharacterized protein YbaR (Trm112 family)/SAM-dependent methyltransferase
MPRPAFWHILACPLCKQPLRYALEQMICDHCSATYPVREGVPILLDPESSKAHHLGLETAAGREMVAQYLGTSWWARFIKSVRQLLTVDYIPYPPDLTGWIEGLGPEALVLEVGSGRRRLHPQVINLDIGLFPNVDVLGDGAKLPFLDGSLDFIILDVVLEHVKDPRQFIMAAQRALRPGGHLYVVVPFIHPYHGYPADYHRFSLDGLKLLLEGFAPIESGVLRGPMVALLNCLSELPFLLTFSHSAKVYQATKGLVLLFTFWLKFLDKLLVRNPQAHRLAHCLYFFGQKAKAEGTCNRGLKTVLPEER